jgi:hypothetical protein
MDTKFWSKNIKIKDHYEDVGADGKIVSEWMLRKFGGGRNCGLDASDSE